MYCYADFGTEEPARAEREDWRTIFADFVDPVPRLLEQGGEAHFAPIEEVAPPV